MNNVNFLALFSKENEKAWEKLATHPYELSARAYFNRSYHLYPKTEEDNAYLFYCALELRCAIEKVLFEYLSNLKYDVLSKNEINLWSAKNLKSAVLNIEPDFMAKLDFLNLVLKAKEYHCEFVVPDLDQLSKDYGRLNDYLHAQKAESDLVHHIDWWADFRALIKRLHSYIWPYCAQPRMRVELNSVAEKLFNDFKHGYKTHNEVLAELKPPPEGFEIITNFRNYL